MDKEKLNGIELNDEDLDQVSGGAKIPGPELICSIRNRCPFTSKSECTVYSDLFLCKYDN